MSEQKAGPTVYTLTRLTRDAGQARQSVVQGFEVPLRKLIICTVAVAISLVPTFILYTMIGPTALLLPVFFAFAALYLIERRTRDGLQVRTYQAMLHKRKEPINKFICQGVEVFPRSTGFCLIVQSSMPAPTRAPIQSEAIFDGGFDLTPSPVNTDRAEPSAAPLSAHPAQLRFARVFRERRSRSSSRDLFVNIGDVS